MSSPRSRDTRDGAPDHLRPDLLGFLARWLPRPPARVLEIGCGDGKLTRRLIAGGFSVTGIDPDAPADEPFERVTLEAFRGAGGYDAAVAIRSLHHLADLDSALDSLGGALRPHARLVVFEFAVEHVDAAARRWLTEVGLGDKLDRDFSDVIRFADLRRALISRFRLLAEEPAPYLARDLGREDLSPNEEAAIARGELKPTGIRLAFERRQPAAGRARRGSGRR